jgi:cytochrome P450
MRQTRAFDPDVLADPFEYYQNAIKASPIERVDDETYLVLSYDLVSDLISRSGDFSSMLNDNIYGVQREDSELNAIMSEATPQVHTLLTADPPTHTHFRSLLFKAFTLPRLKREEAAMHKIAEELVADMRNSGNVELVRQYAVPMAVRSIARLIGLEDDNAEKIKHWSDAVMERISGLASIERERECARIIVDFHRFCRDKIDELRANPGDDLLSEIVNARSEDGTMLGCEEITSLMQQLMVGGHETTTSAIAGGMALLAGNPDQMALLRRDPFLIPNAVEEILRMTCPNQGTFRRALRDTQLGGVPIGKDNRILARFSSASRDPAVFPDPDRFDVRRSNAKVHLAFGKGIHMCFGNMLARMEIRIAIEQLLAHTTSLWLAGSGKIEYPLSMIVRSPAAVPLECEWKKDGR